MFRSKKRKSFLRFRFLHLHWCAKKMAPVQKKRHPLQKKMTPVAKKMSPVAKKNDTPSKKVTHII